MTPPDAPIGPGATLDGGHYRIESELGAGGMGSVYLATDARLQRPVVIKVPHPAMLAQADFRARFEREIRSMTDLEHPHIVRVYDAGVEHDVPYLVVQYLAGGDLLARLRDGESNDPESVAKWLPQVADALDFIHARGFLHRDIKPPNILFDSQGSAYVSDFGIAKALGDDDGGARRDLTATGLFIGSPGYMAPEYVHRVFSPACDQYSLAVVVAEALVGPTQDGESMGQLPYGGTSVWSARAPLRRDLPPQLVAAVTRALDPDPEQRHPSCSAFARAFAGEVATERRAPQTELAATRPFAVPAAAPTTKGPPATEALPHLPRPEAAPRARRLGLAALALVGLAVGAVALARLDFGSDATRVAPSARPSPPVLPRDIEPAAAAPTDAPPLAEPAPDLGAAAAPEPAGNLGTEPEPSPAPAPEPVAEPAPAPEPVAEPAPAPVIATAPEPPAAEPPPLAGDPDGEIRALLDAYARAIETNDLPALRAVLALEKNAQLEGFYERKFRRAEPVEVELHVRDLELGERTGTLRYEHVERSRTGVRRFAFRAELVRAPDGHWRIESRARDDS